MPIQTWKLIDTDTDTLIPERTLSTIDVPTGIGEFNIRKRVLQGGLRDGVNVVEVRHDEVYYTVIADRGMGLWRAGAGDVDLGWQSPVRGPVHPKFVPLDEPNGIGWLRGFDELLVRCGLDSNGAPEHGPDGVLRYPLHGRIANTPAHRLDVSIDDDAGEINITGVVDETRLYGPKLRLTSSVTTRRGTRGIAIRDIVENLGSEPADLELLYHINVGAPLLTSAATFHAPVQTLVPKNERSARDIQTWQQYAEGAPGAEEIVLFVELAADAQGRTETLLHNGSASGGVSGGVSLHLNRQQFPLFTVWKSGLPLSDGYVSGLEPCINLPHGKSFEKSQGRVATLQPGERRQFDIGMEIHTTASSVQQAVARIAALQATVQPKIFDTPQPGWSP